MTEDRREQQNPHVHYHRYGDTKKEKVRLLLDEPGSSRIAFFVGSSLAVAILLSSLATILETVPKYYRANPQLWATFELFFAFVFTAELGLRAWAHTSTARQFQRFSLSFFTIADVLAVVPFLVERLYCYGAQGSFLTVSSVNTPEMQRLTVLRLFRLLRLLRCYTFSSLLQLSMDALMLSLRKSAEVLLALFFFMSMVIVAFSTLLYYAERGPLDPLASERAGRAMFVGRDGKPTSFESIPAAIWFVTEIVSTVGLGDMRPQTTLGKAITVVLMLFSLLLIALPSIVVGRNFAECWSSLRTQPIISPTNSSAPLTPLMPHNNNGPPSEQEVMAVLMEQIQRQNELLEKLLYLRNRRPLADTDSAKS